MLCTKVTMAALIAALAFLPEMAGAQVYQGPPFRSPPPSIDDDPPPGYIFPDDVAPVERRAFPPPLFPNLLRRPRAPETAPPPQADRRIYREPLPNPSDVERREPPGFIYPEDRGPAYGGRSIPGRGEYPPQQGYGRQPQPGYGPPHGTGEAGVIRPPAEILPMQPGQNAGPPPAGVQPGVRPNATFAALPPEDQPEIGPQKELPPHLKRQVVDFPTKEPVGTLIVDTQNTYLYLVLGKGQAMRYGIGVGRQGFTWAGRERVTRMTEWPDWHPPEEMIERQPYLPRFMAGGPGNPMGARALYLGRTLYRIHGTNQPSTIGQFVSSGCIRLLNDDVEDLYGRVKVGTRVVVMPGAPPTTASVQPNQGGGNAPIQLSPPAPIQR